MTEHCYWPLVSDLNNVLSHRPVALKFMSDDHLIKMWFGFLAMFQGRFDLGRFVRGVVNFGLLFRHECESKRNEGTHQV